MTYRNILVAVDSTDEAEQVLKAAREIADDQESMLSVVSVVSPITGFYVDLFLVLEDDARIGIESEALKRTTAWLTDLAKHNGINASEVNVIVGKPPVEIRRIAVELDADLIVLGTHGRHGLGLMLGSTANAVLHGAPCNVLAVKVRDEGSD
jgi:universal stress protein A